MVDTRDLNTLDLEPVLALNNAHEKETSRLDLSMLESMISGAFYARGVAPAKAFLLCFEETAAYTSPNFLWFKERYARFAYIDRIITSADARGQGLARALYEDMFTHARERGHSIVACEVNADPPNPGSDAFHAKLGFELAGTATLANGKTVRYLTKTL